MKRALYLASLLLAAGAAVAQEQEAASGVDLRATLTAQSVVSNLLNADPRDGSVANAGYHVVLYPTFKFNEHWTVSAALDSNTRTYFADSFTTPGNGIRDYVLQASVNYMRLSSKGSLEVRAGVLPTSFGSFMLHYDDAENSLTSMPVGYGYYYAAVSMLGVAGAQVDVTRGNWDGRLQFANSSPSGPRSIFMHDQYANWAGGTGYTIRQGFRVGVSGYHGPYLNHDNGYIPGELPPEDNPASAFGTDLQWARGYWKINAEYIWCLQPWTMIPTTRQHDVYLETRRTLGPRWYAAARVGYQHDNGAGNTQTYEVAAGYRLNRNQLIKAGYTVQQNELNTPATGNTFTVQLVSQLHAFSWAKK